MEILYVESLKKDARQKGSCLYRPFNILRSKKWKVLDVGNIRNRSVIAASECWFRETPRGKILHAPLVRGEGVTEFFGSRNEEILNFMAKRIVAPGEGNAGMEIGKIVIEAWCHLPGYKPSKKGHLSKRYFYQNL